MPESKLAGKLVQVMKEVERVPKNGWNDYHRYAYPEEADIMDAVRGKLAALGVFVLTSVEGATKQGNITEVTTKHTFIDSETGETLEVKGYGQGADSGDKGGYKGITGACKYFLLKNFLISTGDDPERDQPPQPNGQAKKNGQNAKGNGAAPKPNGTTAKNGAQPKPPENPQATAEQQAAIIAMAKELGLDVKKDIFTKMGIAGVPTKQDAERILKRLKEKRTEARK